MFGVSGLGSSDVVVVVVEFDVGDAGGVGGFSGPGSFSRLSRRRG